MTRQKIESIVTEILMDKLKISETKINLDSTMKDLGADSLDEIEIVIEIEQKFSISIPDYIDPEAQKISSLCNFIEKICTK
jgi:acyl carrier protein